jgi:hypothetical protein
VAIWLGRELPAGIQIGLSASKEKCGQKHVKNWDEANERCEASLRNLKEILQEAETESAECAMERLPRSVKSGGVGVVGKITQIPFHLLAACTGLLRSDRAKEM